MAIVRWIGGDLAGPNDASVAANWEDNRLPLPGDDVIISAGYGLLHDSRGVMPNYLGTLRVEDGAVVRLSEETFAAEEPEPIIVEGREHA